MSLLDDRVRLKLAGEEVPIAESYEVNCGVIEIPSRFTMTVGHGGLFAPLARRYPPKTPFELLIEDVSIASGETDGFSLSGNDATTMKIFGRDYLGRLVDWQLLDDRTFSEKTFAQLTLQMLSEVGLGDRKLFADNNANRKAITGSTTTAKEVGPKTEETEQNVGANADGTTSVYRTIKASVGGTRWEFLVTQYRRQGLFLWSTHDGNFVLARPNPNQQPRFRIVRRRGQRVNEVNVVMMPSFEHDTTNRYSECLVFGRGGGGKIAHHKPDGRYIDEEMVAILNPDPADRADGGTIRKPLVIRDQHVKSPAQARLLARRKIAESRRASWKLAYTVPGHTTPLLIGGGRGVWAQDCTVEVIDDELGIEGVMYIENVRFSRDPTTTEIRLMRCEDLVFAEEADEQPKQGLTPKPGVVPPTEPQDRVRLSTRTFWKFDPNKS